MIQEYQNAQLEQLKKSISKNEAKNKTILSVRYDQNTNSYTKSSIDNGTNDY